jgi:hypothetical protein
MPMFRCCYISERYVLLFTVSIVIAFYGFVAFFPAGIQIAYAQTATGNPVCSATNLQHWDKIVFKIVSPQVAGRAGLPANTELDIKVIDDPTKVADVKQTVLNFIKVPQAQKNSIEVVDMEYSTICAQTVPAGTPGAPTASATATATAIVVIDNRTTPIPPPDECPPGTTGTPPDCVPADECPPGTTGTPPNCEPIPPPDECPAGTTGTPPNCEPIQPVDEEQPPDEEEELGGDTSDGGEDESPTE